MAPWPLPLLVAFGVTAFAVPAVRMLLVRRGVLDSPNERSSHDVAVPRGGGLACAAGVIAGVAVASSGGVGASLVLSVSVALVLAGLGFADDRYTLPAVPRLAGQVAAGGIAGALIGRDVVWVLVGAGVVTASVNMVNFMDGINGISGSIMTIWGVATLIVGSRADVEALQIIGAVTLASASAFLPWNFPRARLFLGDVGSYLFGGLVGLGVLYSLAAHASTVMVLAPLSVYMLDTARTILVRAWRRDNLLAAHRDHVYQRLVSSAGLNHVGATTFVSACSTVVAAAWLWCTGTTAVVVTVVVLTAYLNSVRAFSRVTGTRRREVG